jgi:ankyrin repeat protein
MVSPWWPLRVESAVRNLLGWGVDSNVRDKSGRTAFSLAAEFTLHGKMILLLEHEGTDRDPVDDQGRSSSC